MRKVFYLIFVVSVLIFACKTAKKVAAPAPEVVEVTEEVKPVEPVKEPEVVQPVVTEPIVVKTEEVSVAENEDQSKEGYAFYVIIGSFSKPENAAKFKSQLSDKGFTPLLLNSETGFMRVAVGQSNSETEARSQVLSIRNQYPEHKDVWLLKKK